MTERESNLDLPFDKKEKKLTHLNGAAGSASAGGLFGGLALGISYGVSRFVGENNFVDNVAIGVAGSTTAAFTGLFWGTETGEKAVEHARHQRKWRTIFRSVQAGIEGTAGLAISGAIAGYEAGDTTGAVIGGIAGATTGAFGVVTIGSARVYAAAKEGSLPSEEPIVLKDNSVERIEIEDKKLRVPVFAVSSLRDLKEFRAAYQKKWTEGETLPKKGSSRTIFYSTEVSAIFVTDHDLQHFPASDPTEPERSMFGLFKDENLNMKLFDEEESIILQPAIDSDSVWPYRTRFHHEGPMLVFEDSRWDYWRDKSWKHRVILLAQYQGDTFKPEEVEDRYWLIDIITDEYGKKVKRKKEEPQPETDPLFNPQQL